MTCWPRWLPTVLRLAVTLAMLALVVRALGAGAIADAVRGAAWPWVGVAVAALAGQIALSAWRWRLTAGALGVAVAPGRALREYWLSVLGNTALPGGVLGDVGRAVRLRGPAGLGVAAQTVVIERLAGQLALFLAAALGAVAWFWPHPVALAGCVGLLVMIPGGRALLRRADRTGRLPRLLHPLHRAWATPGVWPAQLALSAAILACNLGGVWAAARAVGVVLDPGAALLIIPLTLAAMLIPLSVNGWGLREGAAAALWPLVGVAAPQAVAASVLFGLAALIAALPGAVGLRGASGDGDVIRTAPQRR